MVQPTAFQSGQDVLQLHAGANGSNLTVKVYVDGTAVINHHYPVFVNSTDVQETEYKGHKIRSNLKITRQFPGTRVQVNIDVDGMPAAEFVM